MKKIIHIINSINRGGAENQMVSFINNYKDSEHFIITFLNSNELKEDLINKKIVINSLDLNNGLINKFLFPIKLFKIIKKINPDYIFCWMYLSSFISFYFKFFSNSYLFWLIRHGSPYYPFVSRKNVIINYFLASLSSIVPKKIIYCSEYSLKQHFKFGYTQRNSYVIHNGYEANKFYIDKKIKFKFKKENLIDDDFFLIGYLARYHKIKNHELLFKSLYFLSKKYPNFRFKLLLAGRGINYNNIKLTETLKEYSLDKHCFLFDKISDSANFFNKIDLHVSTSINESFPNVVCESFLCGIESIIGDVGAAKEILVNKEIILENMNPEYLADRIYEYHSIFNRIKDKEEYSFNLRRSTIKKFNINNFCNQFKELLK